MEDEQNIQPEQTPELKRILGGDCGKDLSSKILFYLNSRDRLHLALSCKKIGSTVTVLNRKYYFVPDTDPLNPNNPINQVCTKFFTADIYCSVKDITPSLNDVSAILPGPGVEYVFCYCNYHEALDKIRELYAAHPDRGFIPPIFELVARDARGTPPPRSIVTNNNVDRHEIRVADYSSGIARVFRLKKQQLVAIKPDRSNLDYYDFAPVPINQSKCILA